MLREGTYQRGPAGRAYQAAIARTAGRPVDSGPLGTAGWKQALHTTLRAAISHAGRLPQDSLVMIHARGRVADYDTEKLSWISLHPAAHPDWYRSAIGQRRLRRTVDEMFTREPSRFAVMWRQP